MCRLLRELFPVQESWMAGAPVQHLLGAGASGGLVESSLFVSVSSSHSLPLRGLSAPRKEANAILFWVCQELPH